MVAHSCEQLLEWQSADELHLAQTVGLLTTYSHKKLLSKSLRTGG